jgi:hypothetical protein
VSDETAADAAVRRAVHAVSKPCPHDPPCIIHTAYQVGLDQGRADGRASEHRAWCRRVIENHVTLTRPGFGQGSAYDEHVDVVPLSALADLMGLSAEDRAAMEGTRG